MIDTAIRPDPLALADIIEELRGKNHVRVVKYAAINKPFARKIHKRVLDELHHGQPNYPTLMLHDSLRLLSGQKAIYVPEALRRLSGEFIDVAPNLRTNVGIDFCANNLGGTSVLVADYIALSNNTNAPAASDTSNTIPWSTAVATDGAAGGARGEYTGVGMTRKQATYAHTTSATSFTQAATWTASGAVTAVQLAGLFGGAAKATQTNGATNILFLESTFTATTLVTNDQLSLTWTVNI